MNIGKRPRKPGSTNPPADGSPIRAPLEEIRADIRQLAVLEPPGIKVDRRTRLVGPQQIELLRDLREHPLTVGANLRSSTGARPG